jgi:predicted nucleic acid-binding Zn ribbon protein
MAANELVREGVVVICDHLKKECQHILEKRNKRKKKRRLVVNTVVTYYLPAQVHLSPFWNRLPRSLLWNRVNIIVQPLNSVEFNFIDSTALNNLGHPCKRGLTSCVLRTVIAVTLNGQLGFWWWELL